MVREWGMSDRIGPMAWGAQGAVFLGEDIMHTRDYSDETSRVIDEEVERMLREQEARALEVLTEHRAGLEAVAAELVTRETIDGADVGRLVDEAAGRAVRPGGVSPLRLARDTTTPKRSRGSTTTKAAGARRQAGPPGNSPA